MTENKFPPTSGLCNSLPLLATDHMDMVCNNSSHSVQGQVICIQFQYLSEGANKNSVKNFLVIFFPEQTDSPFAFLHSGTT